MVRSFNNGMSVNSASSAGVSFFGETTLDYTGKSVSSAGDVNGDGYDDVIIGAEEAVNSAGVASGVSYVIFGGQTGDVTSSSMDGTNGFAVYGIDADDESGYSVSGAGDFNNDGYDDIIIGTYFSPGEAYIVFGGASVGSTGSIDLSTLDGTDGFVLTGSGYTGNSVSAAGDVNGDGYADVIIGSPFSFPSETYIVYGGASVGSSGSVDYTAIASSNGFIIYGAGTSEYSGMSVSGAGDFNNDGYDDVIIGAPYGDSSTGTLTSVGRSYIVYGGASLGTSVTLSALTGTDGFLLYGIAASDYSGYSVSSAGDFNGDGYSDVIIGARYANTYTGEAYLVYGGASVGSSGSLTLSTLSGTDGFVMQGVDTYDYVGYSVSGAGDVNNDGYADVIVGAPYADVDTSTGWFGFYGSEGQSYVVLGGASVATSGTFDLADIDGSNGYRIDGYDYAEQSGWSVSGAGDFDGDGYDDVIIGAPDYDYNDASSSGAAYVVCDTSSSGSSLSSGAIGAIIGGVVGGLCVCGCLIFCAVKACNKKKVNPT